MGPLGAVMAAEAVESRATGVSLRALAAPDTTAGTRLADGANDSSDPTDALDTMPRMPDEKGTLLARFR